MFSFSKPGSKLLLHFIVVIWGFTAILGKLIQADASVLVFYRMIIALGGIYLYLLFTKQSILTSKKDIRSFILIGGLIALHWVLFYRAIKVSNVSVTLACFSSGAFFASFLEPLFYKRRISALEISCGVIAFAGIYMIFRFNTEFTEGILLSVGAAFLSALFTVLNGKLVTAQPAARISLYEMGSGFLFMTLYFVLSGSLNAEALTISFNDVIYLLIMGLFCTAFAFVASIYVMKEISPYTVVLTVNLEPVYGIILAALIFGEEEKMDPGFYLGASVILLTLFFYSLKKR